MSDESKTENEESGKEPVETEAETAAEGSGDSQEETQSNAADAPAEATAQKATEKAVVPSSDDLARMLGVHAEEDPDLEDSIRAVSQDVTDDVNTMEQELARRKSNKTATMVFLTCFLLFLGFIGLMWFQHGDQFAAFSAEISKNIR